MLDRVTPTHGLSKEAACVRDTFLHALATSDARKVPYPHWLMQGMLPPAAATKLANLPVPAPVAMTHDGRRESNNSKRIYFTQSNQARFPVCADIAAAFEDPVTRATLSAATGAKLADANLRIEYCQDTGDFWLEPHTDISVKKFTMLIYLSHDPALQHCGTDVYETTAEHKFVYSAPYAFNGGLVFIPSSETWHGFRRRNIPGVRKSIIVNYVSSDWKDVWELCKATG